jgi:hypothetical protein
MTRARRAIAGCMLLAACSNPEHRRSGEDPVLGALQANPAYASLATNAVQHLRESFNSGNCDLIYIEAAEVFRELESRVEWRKTCEQLRTKLGLWESFAVESTDAWQSTVGHVEGTAVFSKGSCRFRIALSLGNGTERVFSLWLQGVGQEVAIPKSFHPGLPRLMDPPQIPAYVGRPTTA